MMSNFKTLEEKFLSDYAKLEEENEKLKAELEQLKDQIAEQPKHFILDKMVEVEGRKVVFEKICNYWTPKTCKGERDFDEWAIDLMSNLPKAVNFNEARDYFNDELERKYEEQYEEEVKDE